MAVEELKRRRDDALAEREYLSLLRRMVHGRLDILRLEARRRTEGGEGSLVDQLTEVLSESERGTSRGEALRVAVPEASMSAARRRVERLVGDTTISDPSALSDKELERAERRLAEEERMVSKAAMAERTSSALYSQPRPCQNGPMIPLSPPAQAVYEISFTGVYHVGPSVSSRTALATAAANATNRSRKRSAKSPLAGSRSSG